MKIHPIFSLMTATLIAGTALAQNCNTGVCEAAKQEFQRWLEQHGQDHYDGQMIPGATFFYSNGQPSQGASFQASAEVDYRYRCLDTAVGPGIAANTPYVVEVSTINKRFHQVYGSVLVCGEGSTVYSVSRIGGSFEVGAKIPEYLENGNLYDQRRLDSPGDLFRCESGFEDSEQFCLNDHTKTVNFVGNISYQNNSNDGSRITRVQVNPDRQYCIDVDYVMKGSFNIDGCTPMPRINVDLTFGWMDLETR